MERWYEYDFAGRRILLAEDNPVNVWTIQQLLEKVGFEVVAAANGKVALERYREAGAGYYDAIIMDINMPVMDGLMAVRIIRHMEYTEELAQIPIFAVTEEDNEEILGAKQAGSNECLIKPVNPDLLLKMLSKYVKQRNCKECIN